MSTLQITTPPLALLKKLAAARKAIRPVEKRGHNQDGGYDFVQAGDIVEEANRVLTTRGILIIPSVESAEQTYGKTGVFVKAHMTFEVVDTVSGESIVKPWISYGFDFPGDKAIYQAETGGTKYFLVGLLSIPVVGADPEEDQTPAELAAAAREAERIRREQDRAAEQPDVKSPPVEPDPEPIDLPKAA